MKPILMYLNDILAPTLRDYRVSEKYIQYSLDVIYEQMTSLLKHWKDYSFRKTILLLGAEEGLFYDPPAKQEARCFVVVTLRNSPLESIQSDSYINTGIPKALTGNQVRDITMRAVQYFSTIDFDALSDQAGECNTTDIYQLIMENHPVAWKALQAVATRTVKQNTYVPIEFKEPFEISNLLAPLNLSPIQRDKDRCIVYDGFAEEIDPELTLVLRESLNTPCKAFVSDSFKFVTRNPKKLFDIIEYLLTHGCAFVTVNYYLENGHVEQRLNLLRAAHNGFEMLAKLQRLPGIGLKHRAALTAMAEQFSKE